MKKKSKKKKSAPVSKKEIKRPAHKKPRAKKHVEAKIPDLPPVPTEQLSITQDILPDEKRLLELMSVANVTLEEAAKDIKTRTEHRKMLYELEHLYEKCPTIFKRVDREKLRFWFKANRIPPKSIDLTEDAYPQDVSATVKKMEEAIEVAALTANLPPKKRFLSKVWSFIRGK